MSTLKALDEIISSAEPGEPNAGVANDRVTKLAQTIKDFLVATPPVTGPTPVSSEIDRHAG